MENTLAPQPTDLMPEGIFDFWKDWKDAIFRQVIFSQKDRVKDLVLTVVENTRGFTVAWVNENWDAIFEKLAAVMGLTLVPQCDGDDCDCERYACAFDPKNPPVIVPEDGTTESIVSFLAWLIPILIKLWI